MGSRHSGRPEKSNSHLTPRERFGYQLRVLRKSKGYRTQAEAATRLGCSQTTISHAERGLTVPSERVVIGWDHNLDAGGLLLALYEDILADDREKRGRTIEERVASSVDASGYPLDGDASEWVCDVTIPDGTVMAPMHPFIKIWRVRNSGSVPWVGRYLRRQGSTGAVGQIHSPRSTPVPDTAPGETVDLRVECRAHVLAGSSIAYFKFADADGRLFFPDRYGAGVILEIRVEDPNPDLEGP